MTGRIRVHLIIIIALLFTAVNAYSQQWSSVQTVASSSGNYRPRIGIVRNGDPVVCWGDQMSSKVMFSRYAGGSFLTPLDLTPSGFSAYVQDWTGPEMAVSGDTIYIVFKLKPETTAGIYLVRSLDGGMSFSDTIRIDPANGNIPWMPSDRIALYPQV